MEEILASIKRVIAEDGRAAPARPARGSRPAEAPRPEQDDDVLELEDPVGEGEGLVSEDAAAASRQALAALAAMRDRGEAPAPAPSDGDDAVLGAAVREMLRPMLRDWLEANLPDMVEALVTREIARITGKNL